MYDLYVCMRVIADQQWAGNCECYNDGLKMTSEEVLKIAFKVHSCVYSWTSTCESHDIRQVTHWISGWKQTHVCHPHEISTSDHLESWNQENSLSNLHWKICTHMLEDVLLTCALNS